MKKIGYLTVVIIFLFASCNGTSGNKGSADPQSTANVTEGGSNKAASASGKLEHLTEKTFKQKVMDYEKNTRQWVFAGDKPALQDDRPYPRRTGCGVRRKDKYL
jgi:hypothetical protein